MFWVAGIYQNIGNIQELKQMGSGEIHIVDILLILYLLKGFVKMLGEIFQLLYAVHIFMTFLRNKKTSPYLLLNERWLWTSMGRNCEERKFWHKEKIILCHYLFLNNITKFKPNLWLSFIIFGTKNDFT